jgi:hypothetical protein
MSVDRISDPSTSWALTPIRKLIWEFTLSPTGE